MKTKRKPYPRTACCAFWISKKLLMAQRKKTATFSGFWELPGGKIKPRETIQEGIAREVKEETLWDIPGDWFNIVDCIIGDPTTTKCFLFELIVDSQGHKINFHNTEPHKRTDWVLLSATQALKKKLMPGLRQYINNVRKLRNI